MTNRNNQTAVINTASSGNLNVVAARAVAGVQAMIKIWAIFLVVSGTTTLTFQDVNGNALSGPLALTTQNQVNLMPSNLTPWLVSGNGFAINNSAAVQISGWVNWSY